MNKIIITLTTFALMFGVLAAAGTYFMKYYKFEGVNTQCAADLCADINLTCDYTLVKETGLPLAYAWRDQTDQCPKNNRSFLLGPFLADVAIFAGFTFITGFASLKLSGRKT